MTSVYMVRIRRDQLPPIVVGVWGDQDVARDVCCAIVDHREAMGDQPYAYKPSTGSVRLGDMWRNHNTTILLAQFVVRQGLSAERLAQLDRVFEDWAGR